MKKANIIFVIALITTIVLLQVITVNPKELAKKTINLEKMLNIDLPDTLGTKQYEDLCMQSDRYNYTTITIFSDNIDKQTILKLDELCNFNNRWLKASDSIRLYPDMHINLHEEALYEEANYYYHKYDIFYSIQFWIYDNMVVADAYTDRFPISLLMFICIIPIFFIWGIVLCTFGIVKVIKRKDTKI